jgi:AcrR family transcriptional regulator
MAITERKSAEERREQILEVALAEFAAHGFEGGSTEAIARAVGISQPYVFRLFGTKKELFIATIERCMRGTLEMFRTAAAGLKGEEALHAIGEAYVERLGTDPTYLRSQMQAYAASDDPQIREVGRDYEAGTFYEGEGRAGIPPGSEPGRLIPPPLKERWTLILGRSQEELPPLLERLGTVDTFMHDSEHSFDCMWFEFNAAWPALRPGGVLISDDVNSTQAFGQFAVQEGRDPVRLARGMALLRK